MTIDNLASDAKPSVAASLIANVLPPRNNWYRGPNTTENENTITMYAKVPERLLPAFSSVYDKVAPGSWSASQPKDGMVVVGVNIRDKNAVAISTNARSQAGRSLE